MDIIENEKEIIELSQETQSDSESKVLLDVKGLKTYFFTEEGIVKAVDGVSFNIYKDEIIGLVGETGCGKSVTALSILQIVRSPGKIMEGEITFKDISLLDLTEKEMREKRGKNITMIFQDPLNSLNPVLKVGDQISEVFELHQLEEVKTVLDQKKLERRKKLVEKKNLTKELKENNERLTEEEKENLKAEINELKKETIHTPVIKDVLREKSADIIAEVGIADAEGILDRYPHELSGGMRQRVMIAMALSCNPALLIADEPTTALDVTIQAQILELMIELKKKLKTSILIITHDLGIIAELCDRVAVMYSGNIVEYATAAELFKKPLHPYTQGLLAAIPSIEKRDQKLRTIRGMVPNLIYPPSGCRFHPRCDFRLEVCDKVKPQINELRKDYYIACHLFNPDYKDSPKYIWTEKEDKASYKV